MFMEIDDLITGKTIQINISEILMFKSIDELDKNKQLHYIIAYNMVNNVLCKEEFTSDSDRQSRLDELDTLIGQ